MVAAPVAAYVPAIADGNLVWTVGQLPFVDGELRGNRARSGSVPGWSRRRTPPHLARICALNALAAVRSVLGDLDRITRIVKVVGFVASDPAFTGQPAVVNGASLLLGEVLG